MYENIWGRDRKKEYMRKGRFENIDGNIWERDGKIYDERTDAFDWCCCGGMFRLRLVSVNNDCADIGLRLFFGLRVCILGVSICVSN